MCGISGFTGPADPPLLERMTGTLVHRGPDEAGFHCEDGANLGIRRLSIVDVETGHQPVCNETRDVWAVFNGEIYNFIELRKELAARGHRFTTDHSDAEVIVHLFEDRGIDFLHELNGMFAIALWDRAKKTLHLVRDRLGVKPLFYAMIDGQLIFGSEIKAVLAHPKYRREPNLAALYHYFSFKNIPAPMTAFQGIFELRPGERLSVTNGVLTKRRWWKLKFREDEFPGEAPARERIRGLLEDAVKLRMRSDVPFGAYLSGGVDSSAVVALMTKFSSKPVKTFSLGYEGGLKNKEADLHFARQVSKAYGTDHQEYIMSPGELVADIPAVVGSFDQPFSGTISTYFLAKLIRKHVKVALSGDGADELFGSYLSHRLAAPMRRLAAAGGRAADPDNGLPSAGDRERLRELFAATGGDESRWRGALHVFSDTEKSRLLTPAFRAGLDGGGSLALLQEEFASASSRDPLNRVLEMEWNTVFPDQVLAFVDFLSMAHSVETRSPFLDYRLAEFAAVIPGAYKIKDGIVKDILKKSVGDLLPDGIAARPKEGFVLPIFDWMTQELQDYCSEVLAEPRIRRHGFFAPEYVRELLDGHRAGRRELSPKVWNLMMFQVWWERYFA